MSAQHVAVIDIGKTNAKLALVDLETQTEIAVVTRPNRVCPGPPWPHFDTEGTWDFLLDALSHFHAEHGVEAIAVTAHGASITLLAADGTLAAPILDYEHTGPDDLAAEYDAIRPSFAKTGSPRLSMGLNVGAQLFWQFRTDPDLLERTRYIVTYPQFWVHRLTGVVANDVTSLGCHTDLWNPHENTISSLVERLGIANKMPPVCAAGEALGPIQPDIARRTGLPPATPVYCGIHDSNASLMPHLLTHKPPFSVISSGTWVIAMAIGGRPVTLDPALDTLVNVNAFGDPVPSARFMGGREHDLATGGKQRKPTEDDIRHVLEDQVMLFPAMVPETGPFKGRHARWVGGEPPIGSPRRVVAVSFYLALVTAHCLDLIGHDGPIIIEGPFAQNKIICRMLASSTGSEVFAMSGATGTSLGAAMVVSNGSSIPKENATVLPGKDPFQSAFTQYACEWRLHLKRLD